MNKKTFDQISKHGILSFIVASSLRDKSTVSLQLAEQPHSSIKTQFNEKEAKKNMKKQITTHPLFSSSKPRKLNLPRVRLDQICL